MGCDSLARKPSCPLQSWEPESAEQLVTSRGRDPTKAFHTRALALLTSTTFSNRRVFTMKSKTRTGRYGRLKEPLIRVGGKLQPTSWDEAFDHAANGLKETVDRYGPNAFGMFSCSKTTNEMNYTAQKFARVVIGSNNIDSCNRT